MKGDISGEFHDPRKNCSGLRAQQGRVLTDGDFNAALDIVDDALENLVRTLLCAAGSPDEGFRVTAAAPATLAVPDPVATLDLRLAPGSFVLGGRAQLLRRAQRFLTQEDWLSLPLTPAQVPAAPVDRRADLVWLEAVERPFRAVEDREILERALGSADTSTRLRPQLRVRVLTDTPPDCENAAATLRGVLASGPATLSEDGTEILSGARLGVFFTEDAPVLDPCAPRTEAGYLGAENHTLKVMLTAPERFVWAIDHGEPLYRVQVNAADDRILFLTEPRDPVLWPIPGQVIEILPWDVRLPNGEKTAAPLGHRARITGNYDPASASIAYDGSLPPAWQTWLDALPAELDGADDPNPRYFYARIWSEPAGGGTDQATGAAVTLPGLGVGLRFGPAGLPGDYWTVSLRTDAPQLVLPWRLKIAPGDPPEAPPAGPRRFFAPLAVLRWQDAQNGPVAEIQDCRNRFRRLCQIKGCCTYQVGDGNVSFGEFNEVAAAVAALPPEGGEICLLPGVHQGPVDLRGRRGVTISGCGGRSLLLQTAIGEDGGTPPPAIDLTGAEDILLRDFAIESVASPCVEARAFGVRKRAETRRIKLLRLRLSVATGAAVLLSRVDEGEILECRVAATAGDPDRRPLPNGEPLVFLAGRDLRLRDSRIDASAAARGLGGHPGGVQIGGLSRQVLLEGNEILGGAGNGVSLGSVRPRPTQRPSRPERPFFIAWVIIDDDGCPKLVLPGTSDPVPGNANDPDRTILQSDGPLIGIEIRRNRIAQQGASGISVVHWFIARDNDDLDLLDDIDLRDLRIAENRITDCARVDARGIADIDAAFQSAIGGICLAMTTDLDIVGNEIRGCGQVGRTPICAIYVRDGIRVRIADNLLTENGRTATLRDPLLIGNIGGIVVGQVEDGVAGVANTGAVLSAPALLVAGNRVVSAEGRALEVAGSGRMIIHGNSLTAHGNNSLAVLRRIFQAIVFQSGAQGRKLASPVQLAGQLRAVLDQIGGSAVLVINTGTNPNLATLATSLRAIAPLAQASLAQDQASEVPIKPAGGRAGATAGSERFVAANERRDLRDPQGPVAFADNAVVFDALSDAQTLSLCAVALLSFDDVAMHDNQVTVDTGQDLVPINTLAVGFFSCRVQGNRFRETLRASLSRQQATGANLALSLASFGLLNASEMNQGTHCFLTVGFKKPRIRLVDGERPVLDTNRHTILDRQCAAFLAASTAIGTR